jgi:hypothetical protein
MRRFALTSLALMITLITALALSASAGAVVVDVNALGSATPVHFNASDQSGYYGVALVPTSNARSTLATAKIPTVQSSSCSDPWLSSDLALAPTGLCYHHGGSVIHRNETFALTWDAQRRYWSGTRSYVEQFLRDVADGSGTLSSPYALTSQYRDAGGRAENNSRYGGGCIDYGNPNDVSNKNTTCIFGSAVQTGPGNPYPASACPSTDDQVTGDGSLAMFGSNVPAQGGGGCLTDAQLRTELTAIVGHMGIIGHTQSGYTPLVVVLIPSRVEVCLDSAGTLCSANSDAPARFCSYHSHITVDSHEVDYVVQPWTALTQCDEPDVPSIPPFPPPEVLSRNVGMRLVSPLSQGELAAITNPDLNSWFAEDGSEINDNGGCVPQSHGLDSVTVGSSSQNPYLLQREYNNGASIESDPFTYFGCAPNVILIPSFVVPSPIDQGEVVSFDGSDTESTLVVPNADYRWSFGDSSTGDGPSVVHTFARAGYYRVKLTVTDRGGNVRSVTQTVEVMQTDGQPPASNSGGGHHGSSKFQVHLQLLPQSLKDVLHKGLEMRVRSNENADGFATLSIPRSAAKKAHVHGNRTPFGVVVGRGTISGIKDGTVSLRVRVSSSTASQLSHLAYLSLTLRLALVGKSGAHVTVQATGRY